MRKKDDKVGNKNGNKKGKEREKEESEKKLKQIRKKSANFGLIAHARKNDNAGLA